MDFEKAAFWVMMYNLPLACMGIVIGMQIGSSLGWVEEVDVNDENVGWGEYMRVRIVLDLAKPLARGRKIQLKNKSIWVACNYEKIPKFCFKCRVVRHGKLGCEITGSRRSLGADGDNQYEPWLRVNFFRRRGGGGEEHKGREKADSDQTPENTSLHTSTGVMADDCSSRFEGGWDMAGQNRNPLLMTEMHSKKEGQHFFGNCSNESYGGAMQSKEDCGNQGLSLWIMHVLRDSYNGRDKEEQNPGEGNTEWDTMRDIFERGPSKYVGR
jgi:hypothetical protein